MSVFVLLGWQPLVLLMRCSFFYLLHLLSAMLFEIAYFLLSILFYWSDLEYILFVLFFVCVSSLRTFLSFCALAFVGFLLLHKDTVFMLSRFFLTTSISYRTLCLALGLVGMYSAATSIWELTKFSYSSFGICVPDTYWRVSNFLQLPYIYC